MLDFHSFQIFNRMNVNYIDLIILQNKDLFVKIFQQRQRINSTQEREEVNNPVPITIDCESYAVFDPLTKSYAVFQLVLTKPIILID